MVKTFKPAIETAIIGILYGFSGTDYTEGHNIAGFMLIILATIVTYYLAVKAEKSDK